MVSYIHMFIPALGNPQSANPQKMRIAANPHPFFVICWKISNPQIRKKCGLWIQFANPQGPLADSPTQVHTCTYIHFFNYVHGMLFTCYYKPIERSIMTMRRQK